MKKEVTKEAKAQEPISYEDLKKIAKQQQEQLLYMKKEYGTMALRLQEAMETLVGRRVELLFKVIEFKDSFNSEFVNTAADTIEKILTAVPPEADKDITSSDE